MCLCLEIAIQTALSEENSPNIRLHYKIYSVTLASESSRMHTRVARKENLAAGKACIRNEFV